MSQSYVSRDDAINGADPQWDDAGKVHDWRNHVPEDVREIWGTFNPEQRRALVGWAEELANREHWD